MSEKFKKDVRKRLGYIITNYVKTREKVEKSKTKLDETYRELDGVINDYSRFDKFFDQIQTLPSGSFSEFQKETLGSLLVSGCSNATAALSTATNLDKSISPFSVVVSSAGSVSVTIGEVARTIAKSSKEASKFIEGWDLPTPKDNQEKLGPMLQEIQPSLETKLSGAWQTLYDRSKVDRFRQASSSMRELISETLHVLAPNKAVKETSWFKQERKNGTPTQGQRAYYAIVGNNADIRQENLKTLTELSRKIRLSYAKLSKYTHKRGGQFVNPKDLENQLVSVFNQTQIYLLEILRMRAKYFVS